MPRRNTLVPYIASAVGGILIADRFLSKPKPKRPGAMDMLKNPLGAAAQLAKAQAEAEIAKRIAPQVKRVVVTGIAIGAGLFELWQVFGTRRD